MRSNIVREGMSGAKRALDNGRLRRGWSCIGRITPAGALVLIIRIVSTGRTARLLTFGLSARALATARVIRRRLLVFRSCRTAGGLRCGSGRMKRHAAAAQALPHHESERQISG